MSGGGFFYSCKLPHAGRNFCTLRMQRWKKGIYVTKCNKKVSVSKYLSALFGSANKKVVIASSMESGPPRRSGGSGCSTELAIIPKKEKIDKKTDHVGGKIDPGRGERIIKLGRESGKVEKRSLKLF